ncbi:[FeFe] hydrogenase H-cluster radical SAM maturase HydG [Prolixibacter sp. SD074]|uniref:[FeFe] hydrogenase H-cluster radical SAM maturase HydG n=1 Tax=Prolixibacter sp. SD074 TaxID=2652391 RepID=UPI00127BAD66|nr:[FeFe] hydrogenase H-cluster radical SAM maturase HydG [Prolixibacter sp. SD074]GET27821.1 [FeFe] hydrogenase H-cluster radical SAM maturase HydG [Prolixibacter sp. SD074]GET31101.1 [FeFe] hydrogenase H-cluster radical SAM maturase HydG [Prolixibacter sp. SD074]
MQYQTAAAWKKDVIVRDEIDKYLIDGKDFIDEEKIHAQIANAKNPDPEYIREILKKSRSIKTLAPEETAALLNVEPPELWDEINEAALQVKKKVYDNRIVFFAPLYCSNLCVNNCEYCGFREDNRNETRRILTQDEIRRETESVIDEGHKRLILVFGEHPRSDVDYMVDTINTVYSVYRDAPVSGREANIRRVNINAAPMSSAKLTRLKDAGIGTYQVFQETYHHETYNKVHPVNTLKGDYRWRLYALHRAMDAGLDDVAIGALFGLYDWRFEVMGLLYHTIDLENRFGVGPHTISFPRITPASGSSLSNNLPHQVSDEDFKKLVAVLRLSVPTAGLIVTAREKAELKKEVINLGCTQTDASTRIGIGAYSDQKTEADLDKKQFTIGDPRDLDDVIREVAELGYISSFCTAGYRCGRTGETIMGMLSHCVEGKFCKLNAVLTFREYLNDYASPETKTIGEELILKEIAEIEAGPYFAERPHLMEKFRAEYKDILLGKRDLYL